jgi:hypothetical protein
MELGDELLKLSQLHQSGALSDAEYEQARAAVLARHSARATQSQLEEISRQQHVDRIDREWELERQNYMMSSKSKGGLFGGGYNYRHVPTVGGAFVTGAIGLIGGLLCMGVAINMGTWAFALFGLAFAVFRLWVAYYQYSQATAYEVAEAAYKRRRARAQAGDRGGQDALFDK